MKRLSFTVISCLLFFASCKPIHYVGSYGQGNQTQVVFSEANFRVLGSFTGSVTDKKRARKLDNREGLVARAKADLLARAKMLGVELTGSRTLVNVTVDVVENIKTIRVTVSAEIVEFTK